MSRLPQELCEVILDHLSDDLDTLISCSLVCTAWAAVTRRLIFRDAVLVTRTWDRFRDFVQPHARRLRINAGDFPTGLPDLVLNDVTFLSLCGDFVSPPFARLLPRMLPCIVVLEINTVLDVLESDAILFSSFPCLEVLHLGPSTSLSGSITQKSFPQQIHTLSLGRNCCISTWLEWSIITEPRPRLISLTIDGCPLDCLDRLSRFLHRIAETLEELALGLSPTCS
jgi:hypothetical protein